MILSHYLGTSVITVITSFRDIGYYNIPSVITGNVNASVDDTRCRYDWAFTPAENALKCFLGAFATFT